MQRWTLDAYEVEMVLVLGEVVVDGTAYYVTAREYDRVGHEAPTKLLRADDCTIYVVETDIPPQSAPVPEATTYAIPGGVPYPPAKPDTSSVPPPNEIPF